MEPDSRDLCFEHLQGLEGTGNLGPPADAFEVLSEEISGSTAQVELRELEAPKRGNQIANLRKVDGDWLIDFTQD